MGGYAKMIQDAAAALVNYGYATGLLEKEDRIWAANSLIRELGIGGLTEEAEAAISGFDKEQADGKTEREKLPEILGRL